MVNNFLSSKRRKITFESLLNGFPPLKCLPVCQRFLEIHSEKYHALFRRKFKNFAKKYNN